MEEINRRRHPRRSVRIEGKIFLPEEKQEIEVLVVNLSPAGAAVETETNLASDTRVVLTAGEFGPFEGKTIWRRGSRLGIRFNTPVSLSEDYDTLQAPTGRSRDSLAFEQMWRSLPREGLIPERHAFQPKIAKRFLRNIILAQAPSLGDPTLRVRVVGDALRQHIQGDIVGLDFLEFIDEDERRARALDIVRQMFERPCGQWWVSPIHYRRGFSHYWEFTALPLAASEHSPAMVLALVTPFDSLLDSRRNKRAAMRVDVAVHFEAIAIDS